MPLAGRHVVLGVSGGIASYKSCVLARRLTEAGAAVDVVLTAAASEFVRPVVFEALTGRPVLTSLWQPDRALAHISLAKSPDLVILAPATANLLARAAMGLADDVLTSLLLARTGPVLCAPAMNDAMWAHPATQTNVKTLGKRGWQFIGPEAGPLAEGPSERPGRMSEPEAIVAAAERLLAGRPGAGGGGGRWAGRKVVVTAGPTREHDVTWVFTRAGLPVEITAESENWRRIRDSEGTEGWVYHSLLSSRRTVLVAPWSKKDETFALHASGDGSARVTAQLQPGVLGSVKSCDKKWCRIFGEGFDGYIEQERLWGAYPDESIE